jgi:hypothetical protein
MKGVKVYLILTVLVAFINLPGSLAQPGAKKLTAALINQTKDDKLLQLVFDNLISKMAKDLSDEYPVIISLNKSQQAIYMIGVLQAEVENGGFNQYYYNSAGKFAKLTPGALMLVGANRFAQLVSRANKTFETENKNIKKHQDGTLEGFSKSYNNNPLNKLDNEFYALEKKENLESLQIAYIRKHKEDFTDK